MSELDNAQRLADLLQKLKQRSGSSYETLSHRTHSSRSALHRYCSGEGIPADYAIVAAIAKQCDASPAELSALARYWTAATIGDPEFVVPAHNDPKSVFSAERVPDTNGLSRLRLSWLFGQRRCTCLIEYPARNRERRSLWARARLVLWRSEG